MITIRAAARKGKRPPEIAAHYRLPVGAVEQVLAPVNHPRLSDPVQLLQTLEASDGQAAPHVQIYWLGFLMAAGRISGQGTSSTLIVTLGTRSREAISALVADLLETDSTRCEFCHSSLGGWQVYLRDPDLCRALLPWGVPSNVYGDDAALLEDLPDAFAGSFLRGYLDGVGLRGQGAAAGREQSLAVDGSAALLAAVNALIERSWGISGRVVGRAQNKGVLRFSQSVARTIREHLETCPSRLHASLDTRGRV